MTAVSRSFDRVFRISVILKAADGALEVIGGLILVVVSPQTVNAFARSLTQHELSQDHHDFIASHVLNATSGLTRSTATFAAIYLLSHGAAKIVVIVAVLREHLWAYPAMIVLLGAFIAYQGYRIAIDPTIGLSLLTAFDMFVVWLTWREWRAHLAIAA